MSKYIFGRDITYNLHLYEDGEKITDLPAQTVTGYLFRPEPSRADAAAGTGALSTFTQSLTAGSAISLTIPAVADPDDTSNFNAYDYWVAVNFILKTGGDTQTSIRKIRIERVNGQNYDIGVELDDVLSLFPDALSYLSASQISAIIQLARSEIVFELEQEGIAWAAVWRPDDLYHTLLFRVLYHVYASQKDDFVESRDEAKASYISAKNSLKLAYDATLSGQPTEVVAPQGALYVRR